MNYSDSQTVTAVINNTPMKLNHREVSVTEGGTVSVALHGSPFLSLDRNTGELEIDGDTPATRKSTRLINAILAAFGPYRVCTKKGQWWLQNPEGENFEFTGRLAVVPVTA